MGQIYGSTYTVGNSKPRMVIASVEFGGKQSPEIWPRSVAVHGIMNSAIMTAPFFDVTVNMCAGI